MDSQMSTKQIVGILDALNADPDLERGCRHVCGLAANIVLVCDQRGEELIKAADTIERQAKEIKDLKAENKTLKDIGYERDAARASAERTRGAIENALAENTSLREQIGDLQGRLWSVKGSRDQARKERDEHKRLHEKYYDLGHNRTCMYHEARKERDAALAEVERLKGETIDRPALKRALDELNAGASEAEL